MKETVSGILLAGGKSRRMGMDKRFIRYGGKSLLVLSLERLRKVADEVILVTAGTDDIEIDNVISATDRADGIGPLMGIYSGLSKMSGERGIVNPVDTPNVTHELLMHMIEISGVYDVVMPRWGERLEPLIALYSKNVLPVADRLIRDGVKAAPHRLAEEGSGLRVRIMEESEIRKFGDPELLFSNINTPDDLRSAGG